jgi:hypothetical protein
MSSRLRLGKAYEHTIFGMLTLEGFDIYHPIVDDRAIDGVIRVAGDNGRPARYYDLQVKGSKTWNGIRCKVQRLVKNGILILYCANSRELYWFLYEELTEYFPAKNPQWGDVFLRKKHNQQFKMQGRDKLSNLLKKL